MHPHHNAAITVPGSCAGPKHTNPPHSEPIDRASGDPGGAGKPCPIPQTSRLILVIRLTNIALAYERGPESLSDVSFHLRPGSFHFLTGPAHQQRYLATAPTGAGVPAA